MERYNLCICALDLEITDKKPVSTHARPKLKAGCILEVKQGGLKGGFSWKHMASMSDPLHSAAIYRVCARLSGCCRAILRQRAQTALTLSSLSSSLPRAGQAQLSDQNQSHFKGRAS